MSIGIDVAIGEVTTSPSQQPFVNPGYAWAMMNAPSVQTTQQQNISVSSVVVNAQAMANAPVLNLSSAINASVSPTVMTTSASTGVPTVSTTKSPTITSVVASSQANAGLPSVSTGTILNITVSSVVAGATPSVGLPTVSATSGGAGTTYLQMDGVDDKLTTPTFSWDKVVFDVYIDSTKNSSQLRYLIQAVSGTAPLARLSSGTTTLTILNGTATGAAVDQRTTLTLTSSSGAASVSSRICARSDGTLGFMGANLYSITFYNGASVVCKYDMSTGNVNDQSGNGYNATNTDGTWVTG